MSPLGRRSGLPVACLVLFAVLTAAGSAARAAGDDADWRREVGARIQAAWAVHGEAYRRIVTSGAREDRLGGVVWPALAEAERAGVDTVPLLYQLLLQGSQTDREPVGRAGGASGASSAGSTEALGRELRAIAALDPARVDAELLAAWTLGAGVAPEVRIEVAWSLAAAAGAGGRTRADLDRLRTLLAAEARRDVPSRQVAMALVDGLIAVARGAGSARGDVVQELQALGPAVGLSAERIVHALGEIGGDSAEVPVLAYLDTAAAETERGWALSVLPRVGSERALTRALFVASDPAASAYLREAAIDALGGFGFRPATANALEGILRDATRSMPERRRALDALREMMWRLPPKSAELPALAERVGRLERHFGLLDEVALR